MPDILEHASVLRLPMGLRLTPTLTFDDIMNRARERLALVALGREELAFLKDPGFVGRCRPDVSDENLILLVPIVAPPARAMKTHTGRGRQRDLLGVLGSDDDARAEEVKQTAERIQRNADLVERAGHVMNTAANPQEALERIEREEGVDLGPARRFHRENRDEVLADLEGHQIPFRPMPVRTAVTGEVPTDCRIMLNGSHKTFADFRAVVEGSASDLFGADFKKGRLVDIRVGMLPRWRRIVLEGARHLGLSINAVTKPAFSTATLKQRHLEVQEIKNWEELLAAVIAALEKARAPLAGGPST